MLAAMFADIFNTEERLRNFGTLATFVVFGIIFAESGLMIGFFLPGDSLLFTAGLLSVSNTHLAPLPVLIVGCAIAAIAGDQVGYAFGKKVGPPLFSRPDSRFFKQKHLQQAEAFFERHGSKTIILARFTPIVRTFAPIVAGASSMKYRTFVRLQRHRRHRLDDQHAVPRRRAGQDLPGHRRAPRLRHRGHRGAVADPVRRRVPAPPSPGARGRRGRRGRPRASSRPTPRSPTTPPPDRRLPLRPGSADRRLGRTIRFLPFAAGLWQSWRHVERHRPGTAMADRCRAGPRRPSTGWPTSSPSSTPTGEIVYVNPFAADLLGFDASESVGRNMADFLHPDDLIRALRVVAMMVDRSLDVPVTPAVYRLRRRRRHVVPGRDQRLDAARDPTATTRVPGWS